MTQGSLRKAKGMLAEGELNPSMSLAEIEEPEILMERMPGLQAHPEVGSRPVVKGVDPEAHRGPDLGVRLLSLDQHALVAAGRRQDKILRQEIGIGIRRQRQPRDPLPEAAVVD